MKKLLGMLLAVVTAGVATAGSLEMSAYWQDHMVLQRGKPITVWGKGTEGRTVTVSFAGQQATAVVGADGFWETTFAQPFAVSATGQTMTIADDGGESLSLADILVGDVYLAAGQSNMDRRLEDKGKQNYEEPQAVKDFCRDDDGIRFIRIARSAENTAAGEELFDLPPIKPVNDKIKYYGEGYDWAPAVSTNKNFVSAVALNFARYIRDSNAEKGQDIPIGIVHASSGGTAIRQWLSTRTLSDNGYAVDTSDAWFWNRMMAPILRAKFCAVLWYQGCSDAGKTAAEYKGLMDVLVQDRRDRWGDNGYLPFYAVQIGTPGYANGEIQTMNLDQYPAPTEINNGQNYAIVREAQRLWDESETGPHGLAVIVDHVRCMAANDLHPADKNFVARRLSLFARRDLYGEPNLTTEGPVFSRAVRESDGKVRISFKPGTAKGLTSGRLKMAGEITLSRFVKMDGPVKGFALCDGSGTWKEAEAIVDGETVVLSAEGMSAPTRFHYGYWCITRTDNYEFGQRMSLYNGEGLPLSPLAPMNVEDADSGAKTADPVLTPASGLFSPSTDVTMSCATTGATIRYTLDGSEPNEESTPYTAAVTLTATTTVKARAFKAGKSASDIVSATYTLGTPAAPVADPLWSINSYVPSEWTPLANNILAGKLGTTAGNLAWGSISKDPVNLTDGVIPVTPDSGKVVGFCNNSSVSWTFDEPHTITELRLSSRIDSSTGDFSTKLKYAGLRLEDVYVKRFGSSEWEALGTPVYLKVASEGGAMMFSLADDGIGHIAENVVGLKLAFLQGEVIWSLVAEVEASGYATGVEPVTPVAGSLTVDTTVSDHCVLQRGVVNKVKGTATPGATVTVTFGGASGSARAGSNGDYVVSFSPGAANATGRNLVVSDTVNTVTISDVLVGDVFYLSGQSNVRFEVESLNKKEALADCDYPNFRMMVMPSANSGLMASSDKDLPCSWAVCSSTTCTDMSSFGFFVGRELIKAKDVPIGIVSAAVKGTYISEWLQNGVCDKYMACRCDHIAVKGAIWYQGESDALGYGERTYPQKLKNLIQYWRTNRGNSNLPVVVVQLPRYRDTYRNCGDTDRINCWGLFRVDQDLAIAEVDNAVCVPTVDYGAEYNIHPSDKHLMGARIVLAVRSLMYGENVAYRCPYPTSAVKSADGSSVTVTFPASTVLTFATDTASESFGPESDMFSIGGTHLLPTISADGHSLVFSGSFASATKAEYAICGYPQILVRDAEGFPMPPFSMAITEDSGSGTQGGDPEYYTVTVTTPQHGTLTASPSGSVAAGTTVTVTATPASGYKLKSVTKNGAALSGNTFTMPAADVTLAAVFEEEQEEPPTLPSGDQSFYVNGQGYDSWADAMNASKNGGTVSMGADGEIASTQMKTLTIDLCGHTLTASTAASPYIGGVTITVIDSVGGGLFTAPNGMNLQGAIDLSALARDQFSISGNRFWTGSSTVAKFPAGWTLDECKATFRNQIKDSKIITGGVTYTYDGSAWVADGPLPTYAITISATENGTLETSVTNEVAAGTTVTVAAKPAEGYRLASVTMNGAALSGNSFAMPAADVTLAATFELIPQPTTHDITITAPANGMLETSVTNAVLSGTIVTVIAKPAEGYKLKSVTMNGAALSGSTFEMPGEDVTLAAVFETNAEPTQMFYIGDTGYDTWSDAFSAAKSGDTIVVGKGAKFFISGSCKSLTIDLCGRALEWESQGWCWDGLVIIDSVGGGTLMLDVNNRNIGGTTLDISSLKADQLTGPGRFWTNVSTEIKFPNDMPLGDCAALVANPAAGQKIEVQGVTYVYGEGSWNSEGGPACPEWIDAGDADAVAKYTSWAETNGVADPSAAIKDAFLLNCANTEAAVNAAKAGFRIAAIIIKGDTVEVVVENEEDFNGKVRILGAETLDGQYHDQTSGDRFFKAVLE